MTLTVVFMSGLFLCRFHADAIRVILLGGQLLIKLFYYGQLTS